MKTAIVAAMTLVMLSMQTIPSLAMRPKLVPGSEAKDRVSQLTSEISWNHSLGQAENEAKKEGKMVFWVQMLGDIAGGT